MIQLLENWSGTSSTRSEVNGSSRYLASVNGMDSATNKKDYSPASTFETAVSSIVLVKTIVQVLNLNCLNCQSGKSSNFSGSTARSSSYRPSQRGELNSAQLSFTQQLQQQAAGQQRGSGSRSGKKAAGLHLPLSSSRVLSPLCEPQSPLYSSPPPPTPPPIPAVWQPIQQLHASPKANGHSSSRFSLLRRQRSEDAFTHSSVAGSSTPPSSRLYQHHRISTCLEPEVKVQPQSSHMQIILGRVLIKFTYELRKKNIMNQFIWFH